MTAGSRGERSAVGEIFSIVPLEVWADKRLTLKQIRVLGVLFSFRNKASDVVWPSRAQIAERCGMSMCHISTATTELERLGWLRKDGKGGHSKSTRYTITVPALLDVQTVPDSVTVPESITVPESGTRQPIPESGTVPERGTVPESGTRLRVPESGTGKEQTSEQTNSPLPPKERQRRSSQTLRSFLEDCRQQNIKPIDGDDPIFDYAEKVGISEEMLVAAWAEFKAQFLGRDSTQKDWRAHYRNAVKRNWFNLWYLKEGENARWTTAGEQARRAAA
jgi:hypothetical protein